MGEAQGGNRLSLCWKCKNTNRFDCSWFNPDNPQPVPGWEAELIPKHRIEETYLVKECPKYEPEPPRKPPAPPPPTAKDHVPGVYKHTTEYGSYWVARFQRGHRRYYLGHFSSREEAVAAIRAAEAAIKRGEEPVKKAALPDQQPGVTRRQKGWEARIYYKGKSVYLGYFKNEEDAIAARRAAEEAIKRGEDPPRKESRSKEPKPKKPPAEKTVCGVRRGVRNWHAYIQHQGKVYNLGYFKTEEKAIAARKAAEEAIQRGEIPAH